MSFLDVAVPILQPGHGAAAWILFLVGFACAVVLSAAWLTRLWRNDRYREQVGYRPAASAPPYRTDEQKHVG